VWAWGVNTGGQLGQSTTQVPYYSYFPLRVPNVSNAVTVAGGSFHSLAVTTDGRVLAWGWNAYGQLGNNSTNDSSTPVQVIGLSNAIAVAAGNYHSIALLADGTVKTWGRNSRGQLGNNTISTSSNSLVPVSVLGGSVVGISGISAGLLFSMALKSDGTVWTWGDNSYGQVGNPGAGLTNVIPVQVTGLTNVRSVSAGNQHGLALTLNGAVWSWGYNANGELGLSHTQNVARATNIVSLSNVVAVAGGASGATAVLGSGTTMAWGYSGAMTSNVPAWVDRAPVVAAITQGGGLTLGLTRDGAIYGWGDNYWGQLGNGTFSYSILDNAPSHSSSPFPFGVSGHLTRGNVDTPNCTSFVIPFNEQKGVRVEDTGTNSYQFGLSMPWFFRVFQTNRYQVQFVDTNALVTRMPVQNPIAVFGRQSGASPLYLNHAYGFGAYAGGFNETNAASTNVFRILVYSRAAFNGGTNGVRPISTNFVTVPRRSAAADVAAWGKFATNGFLNAIETNGLRTTVEFVENEIKPWGLNWLQTNGVSAINTNYIVAGYKLTHVASAAATNYYFIVEGQGAIQTSASKLDYFATNASGWAAVPLYALDFEDRPVLRSLFVDQPHFEGEPLPPDYAGKSRQELEGLTATITNNISLGTNSTYLTLDNSPELRQHPVLDDLVQDLKGDPLQLAAFVINEIELADPVGLKVADSNNPFPNYQSIDMTGVNRSALATLLERQGSPIEQCALLVYLLRKAGYRAGYVWPTNNNLKLLDDQVSKLLRIQVRGAPYDNGQPILTSTLIPVNYPWVVLNISSNQSVQIFPWLKDTEVIEGLNVSDYLPTNYNTGYKWVKDYVLGKTNILNLDPERNSPASLYLKLVQQSLETNGLSLDDVGLRAVNRRRYFSSWKDLPLPAVLEKQDQVAVVDNLSAPQPFLTNIFNLFQVRVFSGTNASGTPVIDTGLLRMADVHNRKFLLFTNTPTTLKLRLEGYRPDTTGVSAFNQSSLTNIQEKTYTLGSTNQFTVQLIHQRHIGQQESWRGFLEANESPGVTNQLPYLTADLAAVAINVGRVTPVMLRQHADRYALLEQQRASNTNFVPAIEDYQGTVAYLLGMGYHARIGRFNSTLADLHKARQWSVFDAGLAKLTSRTESGSPKAQGQVDMPGSTVLLVANETWRPDLDEEQFTALPSYRWVSFANDSAEEHEIINSTFEEKFAISTVRLLQLAERRATNGNKGVLELTRRTYVSAGDSAQTGWGSTLLKNQDSQIWAAVTNAFRDWDADYVRVFITPGKVTNEVGSYVGMGALIVGQDSSRALISGNFAPNSGGSGVLHPEFTATPGSQTLPYSQVTSPSGEISYHYNDFDTALSRLIFNPLESLLLDDDSGNYAAPSAVASADQAATLLNVSGVDDATRKAQDIGNNGPASYLKSLGTLIADPVNVISGEFYIDTADLTLPGPLALQIRRNYVSQNLAPNHFGYGWKISLVPFLVVVTNADSSVVIQAPEMDGSVIVYRKKTGDVYQPVPLDNPMLNNNTTVGIGSVANLFNARIDRYTNSGSIYYKQTGPDGSTRTYRVRDFPVSTTTSTLSRSRPYLETWRDHRGNTLSFTFGTNSAATGYGQVVRVESSNGNFLGFNYDGYNRIVEAYANDGRRLDYEYDRYGDLTTVTLPDQSRLSYEYQHVTYTVTNGATIYTNLDSTHLLVKENKPDGRALQNIYDMQRRVINQLATVGPDLRLYTNATFIYNNTLDDTNSPASTRTGNTIVKDFFGRALTNFYRASLITNTVNPLGLKIAQEWYPTNATAPGYPRGLKRRIDPRGLVTEYKYDSSGNVTNLARYGGDLTGDGVTNAVTTASYNTNNLVLESVDPLTNKVQYTYSATFPFLPEQIVRVAGSTPVSTNFLAYYNVSNVVSDGVNAYTNQAFGLLQREVRGGATNEWLHDGRGFPIQRVQYPRSAETASGDPVVTNSFAYNSRGELVESRNVIGWTNRFDYDGLGRLKWREVFDETGQRLSGDLTYYNGNGEPTWSDGPRFDPEDYVWRDYDGAGHPFVEIRWRSRARMDGGGVEPEGDENLYAMTYAEHDGFGNLIRTIDPRGNITTNSFDAIGRPVARKVIDSAGTVLASEGFAYEPGGQVTLATNALGGVTQTLYTLTGQPRFRKNADSSTNGWTYFADGRPRRQIQHNGAYWETTYNDAARITTRIFYSSANVPLATNVTELDRRGNVVRTVDANGFISTNQFDGLDRLKVAAGPAIVSISPTNLPSIGGGSGPITSIVQQVSTYLYDPSGKVLTVSNAVGEKVVTTRDALARVLRSEILSSSGTSVRLTTTAYAANHHSFTVTNGSGASAIASTTYTDNDGNAVLSLRYPSASVVEFDWQSFDVAGNRVAALTASRTNSQFTVWSTNGWTYDGLNRAQTATVRDGATTAFSYNSAGNLTNRVMPGGLVWRATYNTAGQPLLEYDIGSGSLASRTNTYSYYSSNSPYAGLPQTRTDGRGVVCAYTYDDWLRAATNTHTGSSNYHNLTTTWKFDARGLLTDAAESFASTNTGPTITVRRSYNAYRQLTSETISTNGVFTASAIQSWDSAGRRFGVGLPGFGYAFTWRADGLLTSTLGLTGGGNYTYNDAGLLTSRTLGPKVTSITSRDGAGRPLGLNTTISGIDTLGEALTYTGDGLIASHTVTRVNTANDYTDSRGYTYANLSRRLLDERLNIDGSKRWTNSFVYDAGQSSGPGVLTKVGQASSPAQWSGIVDGLSRMTNETNNVIRRLAYGRVNGLATISASIDGQPMPVTVVGTGNTTWTNQWRATLELSPGAHQLTATARHPSGQFTTNTSIWFTNNASAPDRVEDIYDFAGNVTKRIWRSANGTTNRTQTLSWDARGRLYKIVERDNQTNGFDWTPVYDPLGRRLRTVEIPVTNGVTLTAQAFVIEQYFDPQVKFLALGVSVAGKTTWRLMGPDLNRRYGGLQGRGGFDAIIPGPELFCPTLNDARGNVLAVYDVKHGSLMWNQARPTGYGSVPTYRPPPLGHGADLVQASAFAGIWSDITGYYWRGNRYYDPIAGRWLSSDPMGHDSDVSLFTYANGDPINFDDPDGLYGREAFAYGTGFLEGMGEGVINIGIGVGRLAKGVTFDLGQQITLTGFDIYGAHYGGEDYQFESAAFQSTYKMASEGASGLEIAGEGVLQASGYRFGNQIYGSLENGAETGDYSQFSQNMGGLAAMTGGPVGAAKASASLEAFRTGAFLDELLPEFAYAGSEGSGGALQSIGPVEITVPAGATAEQVAQARAYASLANEAVDQGLLMEGRVSTSGTLRRAASRAAAVERARAEASGTPYQGQAGHVPDTTWTGTASPPFWLDLDAIINGSLGGQANRYPLGYVPTEFRVVP
jgi:RHS repeat-associated protein